MPAGTPETENDLAVLPVEKLARSLSPTDEPASIQYAMGAPPTVGAFHANVRDEPLTATLSPPGGPGAAVVGEGSEPLPTVTITSFEDAPMPAPFSARTWTK